MKTLNNYLLAEVETEAAIAGAIVIGCIIAFCWFISWLKRPRLRSIAGRFELQPKFK